MQKRLFLCGSSQEGKTAMIRRLMGDKLCEAGGFCTVRSRSASAESYADYLQASAASAGIDGYPAFCFLDTVCSPPWRDNEVFRTEAVQLLQEASYYPFAVLDKTGGFELVIPQFRNALETFLASSVPCIGSLFTAGEAEALRRTLGLGDKYPAFVRQLHTTLDANPETLVIDVSQKGDRFAESCVQQWIDTWTK